jgi:hypothetical protein
MKYIVDERLLLFERHTAEAKMGFGAVGRQGITSNRRGTIARAGTWRYHRRSDRERA